MGLTKQYLRWVPSGKFGAIGVPSGGIQIIRQWPNMIAKQRIVATAACESISFWDMKTNELVANVEPKDDNCQSSPISCLAYGDESDVIASGHGDGTVRLLECGTQQLKVVFAGHKGFVSCLSFDSAGLRLASGGKDTEIIVWDVTNNSGLFRLRGHKGPVNKVHFLRSNVLVSASSDTFIKFWNLDTQHCFKTLADHRSEVWSFAFFKNDTRMITGGSESELKVWKIHFHDDNEEEFSRKSQELRDKRVEKIEMLGGDANEDEYGLEDEIDNILIAEQFGTIIRKSSQKVENILLDPRERLLLCHGKDDFFECFKVRTDEEIKQKVRSRTKKERKRVKNADDDSPTVAQVHEEATLSDEIEKMDCVKTVAKCRSIDIRTVAGKDHQHDMRVAVLLANNSLEFFQYRLTPQDFDLESNSQLSNYGHRADVRCVAISADSQNILTGSNDCIKLWSKSSLRCRLTISDETEYPLCASFLLGGKFAAIGTKSGNIQILNTTNATVSETIAASDTGSPIWTMCVLPDSRGVVTGGEDKYIKFWNYDVPDVNISEVDADNHKLTLVKDRELLADDGVIALKVSPNGKFVAAATLDSTVKIHFCDTFKFFLSLYGHKFPVLCLDISTDNQLIVTGSSDKNIKIWGMDFGDCHRSLFAHDDNIMSLAFLPRTHQLFTVGKDAKLKFWDADVGQKVAVMDAHHAEIWAAAVAPNGKYIVTAGHDRTVRVWSKTNEPLILSEEKEAENEKTFANEFDDAGLPEVSGVAQEESQFPERRTVETVKGAEKLIEAVDIFEEEIVKLNAWKKAVADWESMPKEMRQGSGAPAREPVNPNLLFYKTDCPHRFVLEVLTRVKSNELEKTVLELPFIYTTKLLHIIATLFERQWDTEMLSRMTTFIVRVHFGQICASPDLVHLIGKLRTPMKSALTQLDDLVGVNCYAMKHFLHKFHSKDEARTFAEMLPPSAGNKKNRAPHKTRSAAVLSMN